MYVGKNSLVAVSAYLDGYCQACTDLGKPDPLYLWRIWIYRRFLIWHSAWHWTRVLLHVHGADRAALDALPALYAEYSAHLPNLEYAKLEAELRAELLARHGRDWYEPESTNTRPLSAE